MSLSGVNPDIDDVPVPAQPEPSGTGRRWSVPQPPRLSLPVTGMLTFAGIRVLGVAVAIFLLGHGKYQLRHWSLVRWMKSSDGGHYSAIAAHGYTYPAGQLAHASVFSWFPGYPAVIDSIAWLPGVTIVAAGLVVTAVAGLAAAWGLTALGMKLTGDPRISLLMVAIWAVAPSSTVLSMVYAEALFCALAIWALVALVSRRWLTAAAAHPRGRDGAQHGPGAHPGHLRRGADRGDPGGAGAPAFRPVVAGTWWRPLAAALLAPLGLLGYLGYVALATHRLDGWFWVEKHTCHMVFDWGTSTLRVAKGTLLGAPSVAEVLVVAAIAAAALLTLWSLTERIPVYLHVYTIVVVFLALTTSANWISSKPRFVLPAVLLALPLARLLAPLRTSVLVPLIGVLAVATTWFGLYLTVIARWTP